MSAIELAITSIVASDQRSLLPGDVHDAVLSAIIAGSDAVKEGAS